MPASDIVTRQDAAHLLRRAGFGGSDAELTALTNQTREACVNAVMGFAAGDPVPEGPDVAHPAWVVNENQWQVDADVLSWWYDRMATLPNPISAPGIVPAVATPNPLQEKMVLFWHDHFACGQEKIYDIAALWDQMRMFRRRCLDNFTDLLRAASVHPAMLVFLDNESNVVGAEQENFAPELMELYTIGVGNFSESDVVAMGPGLDRPQHGRLERFVLGQHLRLSVGQSRPWGEDAVRGHRQLERRRRGRRRA